MIERYRLAIELWADKHFCELLDRLRLAFVFHNIVEFFTQLFCIQIIAYELLESAKDALCGHIVFIFIEYCKPAQTESLRILQTEQQKDVGSLRFAELWIAAKLERPCLVVVPWQLLECSMLFDCDEPPSAVPCLIQQQCTRTRCHITYRIIIAIIV